MSEHTVLIRSHGLPVDHFGLAVSDTEAGAAQVGEQTGVSPIMHAAEAGQWYRSASLALGPDSAMEIIGPNPDHRGLHPLKAVLNSLHDPQLLFWYVATEDFAGLKEKIETAGFSIKREETIGSMETDDERVYTRGMIGPGFISQRPSIIQWHRRPDYSEDDIACRLVSFSLSHPRPHALNRLFERAGIDLQAKQGENRIAIGLETPKGLVTFSSRGYRMTATGTVTALLRNLFR